MLFLHPRGVKCARGEGAMSVFSLQLLQALVHSGNDWSLLMINERITQDILTYHKVAPLAFNSLMHLTMTVIMFDWSLV